LALRLIIEEVELIADEPTDYGSIDGDPRGERTDERGLSDEPQAQG